MGTQPVCSLSDEKERHVFNTDVLLYALPSVCLLPHNRENMDMSLMSVMKGEI